MCDWVQFGNHSLTPFSLFWNFDQSMGSPPSSTQPTHREPAIFYWVSTVSIKVSAANDNGMSAKKNGDKKSKQLHVWFNQTKLGPLSRLHKPRHWPTGLIRQVPRSRSLATTESGLPNRAVAMTAPEKMLQTMPAFWGR